MLLTKEFKANSLKMLQQVITNSLETNEKQKILSNKQKLSKRTK